MSNKELKRIEFFTRKLKEFRSIPADRLNPKWRRRALRLAKYQDQMQNAMDRNKM
ncbi:hypothetical protein SFC55_20800 [Niallia taxi]|uniref:hypothetical protein n=1 Tax=Niallia taxi TaxID=2499688 RepID=UPI003982A360